MTIEEDSVLFLQEQIESNYKELFNEYLINEVEWFDFEDLVRPVVSLINPMGGEVTNIIALFPPFNPNQNNEIK